jgi:hypothetical protein
MERQEVMTELLDQIPVNRKKQTQQELFCGGCIHFPFTGKQVQLCKKVGWRVAATDGACIHYKRRPKKRAYGPAKQTILPKHMWKECQECGRWLKTAKSIREGIGHGCQRKREKEDKKNESR